MIQFILLAAGLFALGCDDYIFAGLLPGISSSFQSSVALAAQGVSVYGIAYIVALPICVYLVTIRSLRSILVIALTTFVTGTLITLISTNLQLYILGRAVTGIGAGMYLPLAVTACGDLLGPQAKGRALSFAWGCHVAGAVIGIPLGLWLADIMGWRSAIVMILLFSSMALIGLCLRDFELKKVAAPPTLVDQVNLLFDRDVMMVIAVTLLTATAGLGLYVFAGSLLTGSNTNSAQALSLWNAGGLVGSVAIGYVVDRIKKLPHVMGAILATLSIVFLALPVMRSVQPFGLSLFFIWGAMGWSTMTPQQYRLGQIRTGQEAALVALNSSAVSLGTVAGTILGGLALEHGVAAQNLPYLASLLILAALLIHVLSSARCR